MREAKSIANATWLTVYVYDQELETLLGKRPEVEMPEGEHVEEVNLVDYDDTRDSNLGGRGGEAYHEDDDEMGGHGPRVQCAHQ